MLRQLTLPIHQAQAQSAVVLSPVRKGLRSGNIMLLGILADYAISREEWRQARHAFAHSCDPSARNSIFIARIKLGNDFSLQESIQGICFRGIPRRIIAVFSHVSKCPANFWGIGLCPPPIELRTIQ